MIRAESRWLLSIGLVVTLAGCSRSTPSEDASPKGSAALVAAPQPTQPPSASAAVSPEAGVAGRYQGTYDVKRHVAQLSTKQGAPTGWEKDEGKLLAGSGEMTLDVAPGGRVSGTIRGPLGDLTLRGVLDGQTLRATLHNALHEPTAIQSGFVVATLATGALTGSMRAGTGDGLIQREGTVALKKAPSGS